METLTLQAAVITVLSGQGLVAMQYVMLPWRLRSDYGDQLSYIH